MHLKSSTVKHGLDLGVVTRFVDLKTHNIYKIKDYRMSTRITGALAFHNGTKIRDVVRVFPGAWI